MDVFVIKSYFTALLVFFYSLLRFTWSPDVSDLAVGIAKGFGIAVFLIYIIGNGFLLTTNRKMKYSIRDVASVYVIIPSILIILGLELFVY